MTSWFHTLADSMLDGDMITAQQAAALLATPDHELLDLVAASSKLIRRHRPSGKRRRFSSTRG